MHDLRGDEQYAGGLDADFDIVQQDFTGAALQVEDLQQTLVAMR